MKKKVLFLTFLTIQEGNGISYKILSQVKAFNENGCEAYLMCYKIIDGQRGLYVGDELVYKTQGYGDKLSKANLYKAIYSYIVKEQIDVLYIRYNMTASNSLISFLRRLENRCLRLLEIPTYPYDAEFRGSSLAMRLLNYQERYYRRKFKSCLDYIITFVDEPTIYGVKTIKISNAVDGKMLPLAHVVRQPETLRLLGVANINFWHGYDRIIEGLRAYYSKNTKIKVLLTLVGDGNEDVKNNLIKLVKDYNLESYVKFIGNTSGAALDTLFDQCDLAIGCLGCHRKNIVTVKSLKNVEYAMRGVPFIYSELNDDFDDKPYVIRIKPDDSIINIDQLIVDFQSINYTPDMIRESVEGLTWTFQMGKVIREIL